MKHMLHEWTEYRITYLMPDDEMGLVNLLVSYRIEAVVKAMEWLLKAEAKDSHVFERKMTHHEILVDSDGNVTYIDGSLI